jgi:hypothetical protein
MINLGKGDNNILKKKVYGKPMIMLLSYWMKANVFFLKEIPSLNGS